MTPDRTTPDRVTGRSITGGALTPAQISGVLALAEAAEAADGVAPLSEHVLLHLRYDPAGPGRDLTLTVNGQIAGYAYLDPPAHPPGEAAGDVEVTGELVIDPQHRRQGLGLALVHAVIAEAGGHRVRLWAHGDLPAAAGLARAAGFERFRALWQMRRSLLDGPEERDQPQEHDHAQEHDQPQEHDQLEQPTLPPGITLRTFRPGQDEDEWVSLNARAFAEHPEQGSWTRHDLELREQEPWFDPAGFFIAERNGTMIGFHWTKVPVDQEQDERAGEVYVVGVAPGEQGTGLGRALTVAGLRYLRDLGLAEATLYVDEENTPAIRMYTGLGFTRSNTDAMYRQRQPAGNGD